MIGLDSHLPKDKIDEIETERQSDLKHNLMLRHGVSLDTLRERYLNQYGMREVVHTSNIFSENVGWYLLQHPCVVFDEQAYRLAFMAHELLCDLHQRLGRLEYDMEYPENIQNED